MHVSSSADCAVPYDDFSYFGTDIGDTIPESKLDNLLLSAGSIDFNSSNYNYDVNVTNSVSEIKVTPTASASAVIKVNGEAVASGTESSAFALEVGVPKEIIIVVTEGSLSSKTYKITVTRKALTENVLFYDDFTSATTSTTDPLGNGWQYGSTALSKLTIENGKAILVAGDNKNAYNRIVRPSSEARLNQKISVNFAASDLNQYGKNATIAGKQSTTDRYRLLARVQNDPANEGVAKSYYVGMDWNDGIKIGKFIDGAATELLTTKTLTGDDKFVPSKPTDGTYRLEFYVEGTAPTKLTVKYYQTTDGIDVLLYSHSITDDTAVLQSPGSVGFHVSSSADCAAPYDDFSYFGTDIGDTIPVVRLDDLAISNGSLTFDKEKFGYDIIVENSVSEIKFKPTALNTTITVDDIEVASGTNSKAIALEEGEVKAVKISVTKVGIGTVNYVIRITRMPKGAWNGKPATKYAGGSGTLTDPYLISNEAEFLYFANQVNNPESDAPIYRLSNSTNMIYRNTYFQLTNDIVLNFNYADYENWNEVAPANNWKPIGYQKSRAFGGILNGTGHTVYGLYCNNGKQYEFSGLFGYFANGTIEHLYVKNAFVSGNGSVGGIAGVTLASGSTTVNNCEFEGIINSEASRAGGITGQAQTQDGTAVIYMNNCRTSGDLNGTRDVGGLVGFAAGTSGTTLNISNCYSAMKITASNFAGGLVGTYIGITKNAAYTVNIRKSHFAGQINRATPIIGGMDSSNFNASSIEPDCSEDVYYKEGSYSGTASNTYGAIEKTADEFKDGTVSKALNEAAENPITDLWAWTEGDGYPIHKTSNDITNFIPTTNDSLFNDGDWAAGLVNKDGGTIIYTDV